MRSLTSQGSTLRLDDVSSCVIRSQTVLSLSDRVLSFPLNLIQDTLPHKVNLRRWHISDNSDCPLCRKYQSLQHVLNNCSKALDDKRYTWRHNSVLKKLYIFIQRHLYDSWKIVVDLPDYDYIFPSSVAVTSLHPDIVLWCLNSRQINLLELTVCFKENFFASSSRKNQNTKSSCHCASLWVGRLAFSCCK